MKTLEEIQAPMAVAARARYEQDKGELQATEGTEVHPRGI